MVAVRPADVERSLKQLGPEIAVLLFYGPDAGLVTERAKAAAERAVVDPADPFQLIRIDGDTVAADPGRLADEVGTLGLFGARRAIWLKPTSRPLASAVETVLHGPPADTPVIVEAGDLGKTAPLRVVCERSTRALALPCYPDASRDLGALVDETLRAAQLAIDPDARATLINSLGGNRLTTREELGKLVLYASGRGTIRDDDVDAVVSDVASIALDSVIDAAFVGDIPGLELGYRRLAAEGVAPAVVIGAALRHSLSLLGPRTEIDRGRPVHAVVESWRGLHFRRKAAVERQLGLWTTSGLKLQIESLQTGQLAGRRHPDLGLSLTWSVLLSTARQASRSMRR